MLYYLLLHNINLCNNNISFSCSTVTTPSYITMSVSTGITAADGSTIIGPAEPASINGVFSMTPPPGSSFSRESEAERSNNRLDLRSILISKTNKYVLYSSKCVVVLFKMGSRNKMACVTLVSHVLMLFQISADARQHENQFSFWNFAE